MGTRDSFNDHWPTDPSIRTFIGEGFDNRNMLIAGTVVVEGSTIATVGCKSALADRYPGHERRAYDIVAPGIVNAHVHTIQSVGRGIDDELLEWLFDAVLPMEAGLSADEMEIAAKPGSLELFESGVTGVVDHPSVHNADRAIELDVGM